MVVSIKKAGLPFLFFDQYIYLKRSKALMRLPLASKPCKLTPLYLFGIAFHLERISLKKVNFLEVQVGWYLIVLDYLLIKLFLYPQCIVLYNELLVPKNQFEF